MEEASNDTRNTKLAKLKSHCNHNNHVIISDFIHHKNTRPWTRAYDAANDQKIGQFLSFNKWLTRTNFHIALDFSSAAIALLFLRSQTRLVFSRFIHGILFLIFIFLHYRATQILEITTSFYLIYCRQIKAEKMMRKKILSMYQFHGVFVCFSSLSHFTAEIIHFRLLEMNFIEFLNAYAAIRRPSSILLCGCARVCAFSDFAFSCLVCFFFPYDWCSRKCFALLVSSFCSIERLSSSRRTRKINENGKLHIQTIFLCSRFVLFSHSKNSKWKNNSTKKFVIFFLFARVINSFANNSEKRGIHLFIFDIKWIVMNERKLFFRPEFSYFQIKKNT